MTPEQQLQSIEMILKKLIRDQNQHNQKMDAFVINQGLVNTSVTTDLSDVKRGVYGDEKNKVTGLLDRQNATEKEVKAIKTKQTRIGRVAAGIAIGFNAAIFVFKELLFNK